MKVKRFLKQKKVEPTKFEKEVLLYQKKTYKVNKWTLIITIISSVIMIILSIIQMVG